MQKITFFADRPDNCAYFEKVRLEADKERYPILLSNGNLQSHGVLKSDPSRHYAIYNDPFPKPSYLFGLVVAGNSLGKIEDSYTTISGKVVDLVIYGEHEQLPRLTFAMDTLKKAIQWDESKYGLECDLDVYRIVAARHFILGAMENKGLNLFMTSLIATDPSTTTDITYDLVEKTIAHEYFHNWSGNRVTIRDWFEFTLKEGLTVYRDQEFTSDVGLRTATRIEAVKILREKQFAEDASPDRKPIRPENYLSRKHSLAALATSTSYHKGAEVCSRFIEGCCLLAYSLVCQCIGLPNVRDYINYKRISEGFESVHGKA
jgi:aminopeptidase N